MEDGGELKDQMVEPNGGFLKVHKVCSKSMMTGR